MARTKSSRAQRTAAGGKAKKKTSGKAVGVRPLANPDVVAVGMTSRPKKITSIESRKGKSADQLALEANQNISNMLLESLAPSTVRGYMAMVGDYADYSRRLGCPDSNMFPASLTMINMWVASHKGIIKSKSMRNKLGGLQWFHKIHDLQWNANERTYLICNSLDTSAPETSWRPKRKPITIEMMKALAVGLSNRPRDVAIMAIALCAFFGQLRLGEPLPKSATGVVVSLHPSWKNVEFDEVNKVISLFLPWTKTKKKAGETVHIASQLGVLDPFAWLRWHWELSGKKLGRKAPLYQYLDEKGKVVSLDKKIFLEACNEVWKGRGFERYTGHSFRIGGTSTFLANGIDPQVVQSLGRWSSNAFMLYWAKKEVICKNATGNREFKD